MAVLVILPGLDGTGTLHRDFVRALGTAFDRVEIVAYPRDLPLDYAALETRVRACLPTTEPFVLLGESFSGPIAIAIAARPASSRLIGVVLTTTFAKFTMPWLSPFAPLARFAPVRAAPFALLSWWLLGHWATPTLKAALMGALHGVEPVALKARIAAALRADATRLLPEIALPMLYLRGSDDRLLAASAGARIAAMVARCALVDIAGPHLLLQAAPQACANAVRDFLAQLD